jgi:MFS family permease
MHQPPGKNPDFVALWAATSISQLGTQLGALTFTAVVYLHASPPQMGVLFAATTAPALLVALLAGVWVDRLPYRSVMLCADFGRFLLLLSVPAAALSDSLRIEQLYVVGFAAGCLEVLFSLADRSILPAVVSTEQLVDANARLRVSEAVAESVSPTLGGAVVQAASAPLAVLLDALSFLGSGLVLLRLRMRPMQLPATTRPVLREALDGLRTATRSPVLRAILGETCTFGFFGSFLIALFALRVLDELHLTPLALGLIAAAGGLGSLLGAALVAPLNQRLGPGRSIALAYVLAALFDLSIPLASVPRWAAFTVLTVGAVFSAVFYAVENIASLSLRQAVTPEAQMGRINAVFLVANRALRPAGALTAGLLAEAIGVRETLLAGWAGIIAASLWLLLSPLPSMRGLGNE